MDTKTKLLIAAQALEQSIGGQAACLKAVELTLEALRGAVPAESATRPANSQEWAGMSAATAFLLVNRHADGWPDIDLMMNEWRIANPAPQPAAQPTEPAGEPVMIYHGRCTIDCGEHGHQDVELLKMIPAGSTLYTRPAVPLTRERVAAIMEEATGLSASGMDDLDSFEWLVRKVEADHKIGGAE